VLATGTAAPALAQVAGGEAVLVRDATALATIVLGAAPTKAAQLAAFEVQHHVQLITGARLAVVKEGETTSGVPIYVGATEAARSAGIDAAAFKPQEYVVRVSTGAVFLLGCDAPATDTVAYDPVKLAFQNLPGFWEEQGTVHAAYDFLEQGCGVRWFNPTEAGTVCRQTPTLSVRAMERRRVPGFHFRDAIGAMGDNPARYDDYTQLWPAGSPELKKWEELAYASVRERGLDLNACRGVLAHLFLLRQRNGGQMQRCNHSLYGYYERFWRKPETRRPDMFAKGYEGEPPQMCYTSRELIQQLAQDARDYYDGKKTGAELAIFWQPRLPNWFPLEPMDNGSYCKCDACRAWLRQDAGGGFSTGIHSDYFFNFVNCARRAVPVPRADRCL
jgi:hypothetical protein